MYDQALFDTLIGPTLTRTQVATLPSGPYWLNGFDVGSEDSWTRYTYNGAPTYTVLGDQINFSIANHNYYGRDHAYAAMWKMSGYATQKYYDRALAIAQWNYDNYFQANMGVANPFQQMIMSMALLYAMTGSSAVATSLGRNGDYNQGAWTPKLSNLIYGSSPGITYDPNPAPTGRYYASDYPDPRSRARPYESFIVNHVIGAPSPGSQGGFPGGNNWLTRSREALTLILAGRDPTNGWRENGNPAWQNYLDPGPVANPGRMGTLASPMLTPTYPIKPFESGMIHDAMQMHYDMIEPDSRIPPAVLASMNYLQNGGSYTNNTGPLYVAAQKMYKYVEFAGGDEGYTADPTSIGANILNGFLVNNAAFLYRTGQGAAWKTLAEDLMSVIVPGDLTSSLATVTKQWNQVYSRSYKAWPMLYGTTPPNPKKIRLKWK